MRGGEIFVPKAPAEMVAEPRREGARPHQVLVSADEARTTRDLGTVLVIEPPFAEWPRRSFADDGLGTAVPEDYCFSSASAMAAADLGAAA